MDAARSDSFLLATLDVLLSAVGLCLATFPAVVGGNELLGWLGAPAFPLPDSAIGLLIGVVALGGAYPFVTGDWSLGRLGDFVLALTACTLAAGLLGMVAILVGGLALSGENPLPQAAAVACGYVGAHLLVRRGGYAAAKRATGG